MEAKTHYLGEDNAKQVKQLQEKGGWETLKRCVRVCPMHVDPLRMAIRPAPDPDRCGFSSNFLVPNGFGENYKNPIRVG